MMPCCQADWNEASIVASSLDAHARQGGKSSVPGFMHSGGRGRRGYQWHVTTRFHEYGESNRLSAWMTQTSGPGWQPGKPPDISRTDGALPMRRVAMALALVAFSGCARWSQQEKSARMIDSQRACDAISATGHPSFWTRLNCHRRPPLPPECEKPDTDDLPACRKWALKQQENDETTAVINTALF
jgi:hypothetical protein